MAESDEQVGGIKALFSELRRRRVLRSAALYVAVAWVLIQVVATVFPIFELNENYEKYATIALIAGFPIAVVISWIFDFDFGSITKTQSEVDLASTQNTSSASVGQAQYADHTVALSEVPGRSVAVMPFANVGNDPNNEFFSDGIAEELLNLLSKSKDLKVAARTSSFAFKNSDVDVREIAVRLGVRHVLEGSVRREQQRVRISAQLVDATTGFQLWSSSYDRELNDIFAVQDEISSSIVYALRAALDETMGVSETLRVVAPTENLDAYQLYLRGMYLWQRRGKTAIEAAIEALNQAVSADPEFVDAISLLSVAKAILHEYSGDDREVGFGEAEVLANRALSLAPKAAKPHALLGYIAMRRWQWARSESYFKTALSLDTTEPLIHQWYSNLLNDLGLQKEALSHALKAYHTDRLSPQANNILALNFVMLERNSEAKKHAAVAREFGLGGAVPDWVDYFVSLRHEEYTDAVTAMTNSLSAQRKDVSWVEPIVAAIKDASLRDSAVEVIRQAVSSGQMSVSMAFMQSVLLNDPDSTFEFADQQVEDHSLIHLWLLLPEAAQIRNDPRFVALMERMGIVGYWGIRGWPEITAPLKLSTGQPVV